MEKQTDIVFLLDRSGSMSGLERDTIGGYNSFIKEQKKLEGKVYLTTVLFDHDYELLHDRVDIKKVKKLTNDDYYVRGSTALLDAIGITINNIKKKAKNHKVIFVITTDGMENASHEYTKDKIRKMIKQNKNFEFIYLGANIDAYSEGMNIGISRSNIANYKASEKGTKSMFKGLSKVVYECAMDRELSSSWKEDIEKEL
jgi:uncharacterized protein YegL